MAGFDSTNYKRLQRRRQCLLYILNCEYINVVKRYIPCCRSISSSDSTSSYQVLGISLTLVQCRQADYGGFIIGRDIVIFNKLLIEMLFVELFRCLIYYFGTIANCDVFLHNETSSFFPLTSLSSYQSTAFSLKTENLALKYRHCQSILSQLEVFEI